MKLSQEQIDSIIYLHSVGKSDREIARNLHHGGDQVVRYTDSRYLADYVSAVQWELLVCESKLQGEVNFYKNLTYLFVFIAIIIICLK